MSVRPGRRAAVAGAVGLGLAGAVMVWAGLTRAEGPGWQPGAGVPLAQAARGFAAWSEPPVPSQWDGRRPDGSTAAPGPPTEVAPSMEGGLPRSVPVELAVPRIGLRTSLAEVGLTPSGSIDVPEAAPGVPAVWYRNLASPGEAGPAVIVGHVDTARDGPAVFYRLGELRPGDTITVRRADGAAPRFVVRAVVRYPKDAFPSAVVYGATAGPELRLITCGGSFDRERGSYRDNVVVFAALAP